MLLCLTSSMSPPLHSSPSHPPLLPLRLPLPLPPSPWHFVFKLVWCQNRDLVTLSSAVCVSPAHRFCSLAGVQTPQTKRPIDCFGGRGRGLF